ncbi:MULTISPECIES: hypothetical protein [unclassified Serinicoccus]|uniref:hypothetical protein n=1 Tax=unclassified Serinicoccus TaxID=2643101 RepID=UPI0038544611
MNATGVEVTAGLGGFLVVFALALAVWFLGRDLTRRLRRMRRAEDRRLEQEAALRRTREEGRPADGSDEGDPIG